MKIIAINGSPKKMGNTYHAIKLVEEELIKENIEVEIIHIGNKNFKGCTACEVCMKNRDEKCVIDDGINEIVQKIKKADGILLGSPVYFSGVTGDMKTFLDRLLLIANVNGILRHKVGASVVAVRRSGGIPTFNQLNNFLTYSEMIIPTSNYWNVIHGRSPKEILHDEEGVQIMRVLGKNMAWILKIIENGRKIIPAPKLETKKFMSFIR